MNIVQMSQEDFYTIKENLEEFWGDRFKTFVPLHHPMFFYSFGNTAYVIKHRNEICAYLLGFFSQTETKAYVHMINVKEKYRKCGYGKALYDHFISVAKEQRLTSISAITSPGNKTSINFHKKLGLKLLGEENSDGIPVIKDYAGKGEDRVVFQMKI